MEPADEILDPLRVEPSTFVEAPPTRPPWKVLAAIAGVLVAVALFALVRDGSSADEPEESTADETGDEAFEPTTAAPSTEAAEPTLGAQLHLVESARFPDGVVLGSFDVDGSLFLYLSLDSFTARNPRRGPGARVHERRSDGRWVDHGTVLPDTAITGMAHGPDGVLAVGLDRDGAPVFASTVDGLDWGIEPLPVAPGMTPVAVAATDAFVAVAGRPSDPFVAITDSVTPLLDELGPWAWAIAGSDAVEIVGPLGYRWASIPYADLTLTPPVPTTEPTGVLWTRIDGSWRVESTGVIDRLTPGEGGAVLREGTAGIERSTDGQSWESLSTGTTLRALQPWRGGYLGFGNGRTIDTYDADLTPGPVLRIPQLAQASSFGVIQTGPIGVGLVTLDIDEVSPADDPDVIILRDDAVVTFHRHGRVVVEQADRTTHEFEPWNGNRNADDVQTDLQLETLTFLDPETGEPIVALTYDELERVAERIATESTFSDRRSHLLFSQDGLVWSRNNLGDFDDSGSTVSGIHVGDDSLTMFVVTGGLFPGGDIEVVAYTAALPADIGFDQ